MREHQLWLERRNLRLASVLTVAALAVNGCSEANSLSKEVTLRADISPVLQDRTRCNGGAVRPCAALIRDSPEQSASFLNADSNQTTPVKWPLEKYGAHAGDPITVVCQVRGQAIFDTSNQNTGKHVSDVWDVVTVPYDQLAASRQNPQRTPATSFGYAADLLLGNHGVYAELAPCSAVENPAGAKPVK